MPSLGLGIAPEFEPEFETDFEPKFEPDFEPEFTFFCNFAISS
jgi:hypothetical protein